MSMVKYVGKINLSDVDCIENIKKSQFVLMSDEVYPGQVIIFSKETRIRI